MGTQPARTPVPEFGAGNPLPRQFVPAWLVRLHGPPASRPVGLPPPARSITTATFTRVQGRHQHGMHGGLMRSCTTIPSYTVSSVHTLPRVAAPTGRLHRGSYGYTAACRPGRRVRSCVCLSQGMSRRAHPITWRQSSSVHRRVFPISNEEACHACMANVQLSRFTPSHPPIPPSGSREPQAGACGNIRMLYVCSAELWQG